MEKELDRLVQAALKEDIGGGDITTATLFPENPRVTAELLAKADGVVCGLQVLKQVFLALSPSFSFRLFFRDGAEVKKGSRVLRLRGPLRELLMGERTALNFLQHLSGIATRTRQFVQKAGRRMQILDTRKTTPLLRILEKQAVRAGGGRNHRSGLFDMILIKDNHLAGYMKIHHLGKEEAIAEAVRAAKCKASGRYLVEVEVGNCNQARVAYQAGADIVMFDNAGPAEVRKFAKILRGKKRKVIVEWSGGVDLKNIPSLRQLPVDWVSVGSLTHSAPALDFSLKIL